MPLQIYSLHSFCESVLVRSCRFQTILDLVAHCFQALPLLKVHVGGRIVLIFGVQFSPENDHQYSLLTVGFFVWFSSEPSVRVTFGCVSCLCRLCVHACSVTQLCPTLCDPMDCSLPGPSVHGMAQARMLEWAAVSSSRGSSCPRGQICVSCIAGGFFTC